MAWILCTGIGILGALWLARHRQTMDPPAWWAGWLVPAAAATGVVVLWPGWLILRKAVALLVLPVGLVWLGLMAAPLLAGPGRPRRLLVALLAVYTAAGSPLLGNVLLGTLEGAYEEVGPLEVSGAFDAVFVLGGGSGVTPGGKPQLAPPGDRLRLAAVLYRAGMTRRLVTSGSGFEGRDLSAETREVWLQLGIPAEAIVALPEPLNTSQEIARYAELQAERGWSRVGLITSARHMWRAQVLARHHGLRMEPLPADFRTADVPPSFLALIPQASGFQAVEMAGWEYLGTLSAIVLGS